MFGVLYRSLRVAGAWMLLVDGQIVAADAATALVRCGASYSATRTEFECFYAPGGGAWQCIDVSESREGAYVAYGPTCEECFAGARDALEAGDWTIEEEWDLQCEPAQG